MYWSRKQLTQQRNQELVNLLKLRENLENNFMNKNLKDNFLDSKDFFFHYESSKLLVVYVPPLQFPFFLPTFHPVKTPNTKENVPVGRGTVTSSSMKWWDDRQLFVSTMSSRAISPPCPFPTLPSNLSRKSSSPESNSSFRCQKLPCPTVRLSRTFVWFETDACIKVSAPMPCPYM